MGDNKINKFDGPAIPYPTDDSVKAKKADLQTSGLSKETQNMASATGIPSTEISGSMKKLAASNKQTAIETETNINKAIEKVVNENPGRPLSFTLKRLSADELLHELNNKNLTKTSWWSGGRSFQYKQFSTRIGYEELANIALNAIPKGTDAAANMQVKQQLLAKIKELKPDTSKWADYLVGKILDIIDRLFKSESDINASAQEIRKKVWLDQQNKDADFIALGGHKLTAQVVDKINDFKKRERKRPNENEIKGIVREVVQNAGLEDKIRLKLSEIDHSRSEMNKTFAQRLEESFSKNNNQLTYKTGYSEREIKLVSPNPALLDSITTVLKDVGNSPEVAKQFIDELRKLIPDQTALEFFLKYTMCIDTPREINQDYQLDPILADNIRKLVPNLAKMPHLSDLPEKSYADQLKVPAVELENITMTPKQAALVGAIYYNIPQFNYTIQQNAAYYNIHATPASLKSCYNAMVPVISRSPGIDRTLTYNKAKAAVALYDHILDVYKTKGKDAAKALINEWNRNGYYQGITGLYINKPSELLQAAKELLIGEKDHDSDRTNPTFRALCGKEAEILEKRLASLSDDERNIEYLFDRR